MGSDRVIVSDRVIGSDCVFGSDRVLGSDRVFGSDRYPQKLVDYLKQQSVSYVVVGHTPHGNAPTAIPHDGVTCIMVPCLPSLSAGALGLYSATIRVVCIKSETCSDPDRA